MSKSSLILLITRVCCGLIVFESVTNVVFEWVGKTHSTPIWVATAIGGALTVAIRAFWNEKKKEK